MKISDALRRSALRRNEAELLLSNVLHRERTWIIAHDEEEMDAASVSLFQAQVRRRERGEPIAYILGRKEFYGRTFHVDARVLIPRPSTEGLIEATLQWLQHPENATRTVDNAVVVRSRVLRDGRPRMIVDVGTGSGCVAITLALLLPDVQVIATDCSADALAVARENARHHGVHERIEFREGSLLEPIGDLTQPFLLVSNPPYVPSGFPLEGDTLFEPRVALIGGREGQEIVREIEAAAEGHPSCAGTIVEGRAC